MDRGSVTYYKEEGMLECRLPYVMGTKVEALLFHSSLDYVKSVWSNVVTMMDFLNTKLNKFADDSEVKELSTYPENTELFISKELYEILFLCKDYYEKTEGLFDVTLNDFKQVKLLGNRKISFEKSGILLDFGGFAKGYVMRLVKALLKEAGIDNAFINFGNSAIMGIGHHPYGDCWKVGVQNPYTRENIMEFSLKDSALSTSGNTPNYHRHIVNPFNGEYCEQRLMSTIVAQDPLDAEILSTVWMIANEEQLNRIKNNFNIENEHKFII